jgi:uroporphyrin-III C-methyltransferase
MKTYKNPQITLVGAGPGDVELITLKGLKAIQTADVVFYDALVNPQLLNFAPENALKIYVGKRRGVKAYSQEQINNLIVDFAFTHGHVVRLKGGDSFVFGRGFEELEIARAFNIPVQVIPGISSSIAVPALAGIPVTHRGASNSFWVLSGTLADGSLNPEIEKAAQSSATVVILMGLYKLAEIADIYKRTGKSSEAIALVSNGSLENEKTVIGNIANINRLAIANQVLSPAVIVIGEVVKHAAKMNDNHAQNLFSRVGKSTKIIQKQTNLS